MHPNANQMKTLCVILSSGQTLHSRCIRQRHQEAASGCALPHRHFHQTKISGEHHVSERQEIKLVFTKNAMPSMTNTLLWC